MAIKIKVIFCALLFFAAGTVFSQQSPLSKRRDSLVVSVTTAANIPLTGSERLTPAKIKWIINLAYLDVCRELPAMERYDTIVISTTLEGALIPLDFDRLIGIDRQIDSTRRIPLKPLLEDSLGEALNTIDKNYQKNKNDMMIPGYYKLLERRIFFYPKWSKDTTQTYIIHYFGMGAPLAADSDTVQVMPKFVSAIIYKAAEQAAALRQDEWLTVYYQNKYKAIEAEY